MDYKDTKDFLYSLHRHGIKLGLESISAVLSQLGEPHRRYETLHIGGTNGKGSTAAMLACILQDSGLRVGLYTSPHLVDFRERIRVNGIYIPPSRVIELTQKLRAIYPSPQTFFEFTTAMAFIYFADEHVDVAVTEVGMGGRFDATNVISPLGVVITTIAYDHQRYLGQTLSEIAFEKAGIIKDNRPVIVGDIPDEAAIVIRRVAKERQAPYYAFGSDFHVVPESPGQFRYEGVTQNYSGLSCALQGEHQMKNAACALALLEHVQQGMEEISESTIRSGLGAVRWEGRMEILEKDPILIIDGAHNPASAEALRQSLIPLLKAKADDAQLFLIIGMMQDKDCKNFITSLRPLVDCLILTQVSVPRAASLDELKQHTPQDMAMILQLKNPSDAVARAKELARPSDVICVTGSLFLAGEVRNLILGTHPTYS